MSLVPREPLEGLTSLREALNRLLEESFVGPRPFEFFGLGRSFPIDVRETDTEYVVEAPLPGLTADQIQISASEDALTIRATMKGEKKEEKPGAYIRRERYTGEMVRMIRSPAPIDPSRVTATYEHGELTVTLPKAAHVQPKQVPVQVKEAAGTR